MTAYICHKEHSHAYILSLTYTHALPLYFSLLSLLELRVQMICTEFPLYLAMGFRSLSRLPALLLWKVVVKYFAWTVALWCSRDCQMLMVLRELKQHVPCSHDFCIKQKLKCFWLWQRWLHIQEIKCTSFVQMLVYYLLILQHCWCLELCVQKNVNYCWGTFSLVAN